MHFVAETGTDIPPEVPRHDALVYREAQTCGAEILTSDAELWLACKKIRSPAVLPLELIRRYNGVALANTIFGVIPTRDSGSIFVRAYPGPWASLRTPQRFTLVHFPAGVIWLYYETAERKWIAELTGYKRLQVATEITDGMLQTVGLSWKFGEQITLRVADAEHPHVVEMRAPLPNDVEGRVQIGGHPSGQHYWNGPIYVCVNDDRPIGKDAWREFKQDRELTPNPFDNDRLWMFMAHVLR
ncbi:MAG: hypothetical protein HYY78_16250 [Betaproteobacteria bacterium]|nr:hypothetical protein [Betaproteobacteria bacterium]